MAERDSRSGNGALPEIIKIAAFRARWGLDA